jgi:hypothetical protein
LAYALWIFDALKRWRWRISGSVAAGKSGKIANISYELWETLELEGENRV